MITQQQMDKLEELVGQKVACITYDDNCPDEVDHQFTLMCDRLGFDIDMDMNEEQYQQCLDFIEGVSN